MEPESQERNPTNPARRLKQFIEHVRASKSLQGQKVVAAWIKCDEKDFVQVFSAWLDLLRTARSARLALEALDENLRIDCSKGVDRVIGGLQGFMLNQQIETLQANIAPGDEGLVGVAAILLDGLGHEQELNEDELAKLKSGLVGLTNDIEQDDEIPPQVRATARKIIERIETAFRNYRISGAEGIADALAYAYGLWLLEPSSREALHSARPESALVKFWGWVKELHTAISIATDSSAAGKFLAEAFDSLSDIT